MRGTYKFLDKEELIAYLNSEEFMQAAQIYSNGRTSAVYHQCNNKVWDKFLTEFQASYLPMVAPLVEKYKLLV